jgi:hypothetical protein
MHVEVVPVDALGGGEETLSRLLSGKLITSESGPEPSVFFVFVFGTDQGALSECT